MKIATWNLERPNGTHKRNQLIVDALREVDADILILTETNEMLDYPNCYQGYHTALLPSNYYKKGERRVSIYSKYETIGSFPTFRDDTSICITFNTPLGNLAVYGTVIGIYGNRRKDFIDDLELILQDIDRISSLENLCVAGDFNMSWDNYYFTAESRRKMNESFLRNGLVNLTGDVPQNIDHIVLGEQFAEGKHVLVSAWNLDKKLSDHVGVCVEVL